MKISMLFACFIIASNALAKDTYVKPHIRKDGSFVQGHRRSTPNSTETDNFSTKGNVNPYTGEEGTIKPRKEKNYWNDSQDEE